MGGSKLHVVLMCSLAGSGEAKMPQHLNTTLPLLECVSNSPTVVRALHSQPHQGLRGLKPSLSCPNAATCPNVATNSPCRPATSPLAAPAAWIALRPPPPPAPKPQPTHRAGRVHLPKLRQLHRSSKGPQHLLWRPPQQLLQLPAWTCCC